MADSPPFDTLDDDAGPNLRPGASFTTARAPLGTPVHSPASAAASPPPEAPPAGLRVSVGATSADIEALYRSHFAKVCTYFKRCGETDAVARELAQDTFIQALRGCAKFDGRSQLSTWMWAIARNTLLGHLRKQERRVGDDDSQSAASIDPDTLSSVQSGRQMEQDACLRRGFAAFAHAHPERAQVLFLAAVEGWTREELAAHLGRTPHAATEYLSQCRAKLRPFIEGCDGD